METGAVADDWAVNGVSRDDSKAVPGNHDGVAATQTVGGTAQPRTRLTNLLSVAVGLIGLAALGASAWVYAETQREIKRVSTDIAQIRVSLELFNRQQTAGSGETASSSAGDLQALSNRLALLEANQQAAPAAAALPALPGDAATGATVATGGDCLPVGTRFMMSAGDSYAVCDTTATVGIAAVDNGYVTLTDGTIVAQGGTIALPGTRCMLGVLPDAGDGLSGFAEVRVIC